MGILLVIMCPQASKIYIWITISFERTTWVEYKPLFQCAFQIMPNSFKGIFMWLLWIMVVSCTLMCCKRYVRSAMAKIQKHANNTWMINAATCFYSISISSKSPWFGGGVYWSRVFWIKSKGLNYTLCQSFLFQCYLISFPLYVHTKITFHYPFAMESNIVIFQLFNQVIHFCI